jgi:hypothetical protein
LSDASQPERHRHVRRGVRGAGSSSAHAQAPCSERVTADWAAGRLGPGYPVACYQAALAHLPEDVRIYSSAEDDIRRAMLAAITSQAKRPAPRPAVRRVAAAQPRRPAVAAAPAREAVAESVPNRGGRSIRAPLAVLVSAALVLVLAVAWTYRARRFRRR